MTTPTKVLFIAGWGRSGTTLLDMMFGQIEGFFSLGEVRYLWDRGLIENSPCGCGAKVRECPVWSAAAAPYLASSTSELEAIVALRDRFRSRDCWRGLRATGRRELAVELAPLVEHLGAVYRNLIAETGARVLVDSSKFPSHGYLLGLIPEVELYVVHLVRDPRAVAYSWLKRGKVYDVQADGTERFINTSGVLRSTGYWLTWNALTELLWGRGEAERRYFRLRYEDWIAAPRASLEAVLERLGETAPLDLFVDDTTVALEPKHIVAGNPARFRTGEIALVADEVWRREMKTGARLASTALAAPLLGHYGYRLASR